MYHRYSPEQGGGFRRQSVLDAKPPGEPPAPPPTPKNVPLRPSASPVRSLPAVERLLPLCSDDGDTLLLLILLLLLADGNDDAQGVALTLAIFLFLQSLDFPPKIPYS